MAVEHFSKFRVRYDEADQMGVVHHSRYLAFFELGRLELVRAAGLPALAQEEGGRALTLRNIAVRYLAPARYDDWLELTTRVEQVRDGEIVFKSRLFRTAAPPVLVAEATAVVAAITPEGAARPLSPEELAAFGGPQP
jgi:acyl-CoA thioester hydrolase